jgi:hypothetical protein
MQANMLQTPQTDTILVETASLDTDIVYIMAFYFRLLLRENNTDSSLM